MVSLRSQLRALSIICVWFLIAGCSRYSTIPPVAGGGCELRAQHGYSIVATDIDANGSEHYTLRKQVVLYMNSSWRLIDERGKYIGIIAVPAPSVDVLSINSHGVVEGRALSNGSWLRLGEIPVHREDGGISGTTAEGLTKEELQLVEWDSGVALLEPIKCRIEQLSLRPQEYQLTRFAVGVTDGPEGVGRKGALPQATTRQQP